MFDNREIGSLTHCSGDYKLKQICNLTVVSKLFYIHFDRAVLILGIHPADKIMQWCKDTLARIFFSAFLGEKKIYQKNHINQ